MSMPFDQLLISWVANCCTLIICDLFLNLDAILALQESWRGKIVISLMKYRNNNNYYAGMLKFEAKIKE